MQFHDALSKILIVSLGAVVLMVLVLVRCNGWAAAVLVGAVVAGLQQTLCWHSQRRSLCGAADLHILRVAGGLLAYWSQKWYHEWRQKLSECKILQPSSAGPVTTSRIEM